MMQLDGTILSLDGGYAWFMADEPHECPVCHRMSYFFENHHGVTTCTGCEGEVEP